MTTEEQYKKLKVTPGTYVPNTGIEYPEDPSIRMVRPTNFTHPFVMDENYPYYEDNFHYWLNYVLDYAKFWFLVHPLLKILYGLKVERNGIMKRYKKEFRNGAITI